MRVSGETDESGRRSHRYLDRLRKAVGQSNRGALGMDEIIFSFKKKGA